MNDLRCVVFDFGFTLCPDYYFNVAPPGFPQWQNLCQTVIFGDALLLNRWMIGEIGLCEIAQILCQHGDLGPEEMVHYLELGCQALHFNPAVLNFAMAQTALGRKTALVTVNMDVFSSVVVPAHHLDGLFDVIVNSSDFNTLRKDRLWSAAFEQLGDGHTYATSLLIDDGPAQVALFKENGGMAYRYTSDADFLAWLTLMGLNIPSAEN